MRKKTKRYFSAMLAAIFVVSATAGGVDTQAVRAEQTDENDTAVELSTEQVEALNGEVSLTRTSVHDPSVIMDGSGNYYIFGSHMGVSKTSDLQNWTSVTGETTDSTLFGNAAGEVVPYTEAFTENAYTGSVTILDEAGNPYEVDFGSYDTATWISDNTVAGNMWAPDVIYNELMGKWCLYMSLNGATWNSAVVLMTADNIEGPYVYQGPVVFSGFSTTDSSKSYKNTDLELVIGEQEELPVKYQKIADSSWGTYWPHAIDPCVFYDEAGKLWLAYGSWSGGIYMLELDEETGLRDYTVSYESDFDTLGASVTSDAYFGKKIAGGYYVSGEGSYIEHIGDYYYLFMSYGFYSPEGGYNMRVFRSETPDGPYTDASGNSAIFNKYIMNYSNTNSSSNIGMKLMGNYKWDTMEKAEVAQGHNSAFVDADGKAYVVYHTKFNDGTATHEVRVHQLFVNEDGWLVAAPYEYSGETISDNGYSMESVSGNYDIIVHDYQIDYADLEYKAAEEIVLNADGTITGAYEGSFYMTEGTPYATLVLDGVEYKGVFTEQVIDKSNITTICFTVVSDAGLSIWGSGEPTDDAVVAQNAVSDSVVIPLNTYTDIELPTEGLNGAVLSWTSSNPEVLSEDGKVTIPQTDTTVILTEKISKGNYFYTKEYSVVVKAEAQNNTDSMVVGRYFTDEAVDLSQHLSGDLSVANPFYSGSNYGLDLSGGVTIEFDAKATGDVHVLGTIFSFLADNGDSGRLYFTPGSYLGYNAAGSYFDANMSNYALVTDYIGSEAHVAVSVTSEGFYVTVNDEVAYTEEILTTDNGAGTVTDYETVLNWLYEAADALYFGHGSWWNAVGYDEANVLLSNVVCTVGPIAEKSETEDVTDTVTYSKEQVVLESNADITIEENPFYKAQFDVLSIAYTVNFSEEAVKNGWDGLFSFYNTTTGGRVSVQSGPYICYNDNAGKWIDINQPTEAGSTLSAYGIVAGQDYDFNLVITEAAVEMYLNGVQFAVSENKSDATYRDLLDFVSTCDVFTYGVGLAQSAYWYTELCTLKDVSITAKVPAMEIVEKESYTIDATTDCEVVENPYFGQKLDKLHLEYNILFADNAAKNGWDGIFSFYNSETGGRVSFQSAPYICYNDNAGNWMDINQPGAGGDNITTSATSEEAVAVSIDITPEGVTMYANDTELVVAENSSGVTYADLLDYITTCDQLTYGVGEAQTAYWWSELCTISDLKMVPVTVTAQTMEDETEGGVVSVCGSGKNIAITAEAAKNYEFIGWYVDSVLIGEDSTMDISVCKDVTVVAQFKKLPIETEYRTVSGWGNYVLGTLSVKIFQEKT